MNTYQSTIRGDVAIAGVGLHTGHTVTLRFRPAPPNHGIRFKRVDLGGQPEVEALVDYVVDTSRGTTIQKDEARVGTVEHVMASLAGLQIDNVLIEIDADETPILDGSSIGFITALQSVGIRQQTVKRDYIRLSEPVTYEDPELEVTLGIEPAQCLQVEVKVDYGTEVLGEQIATLDGLDEFTNEIAPCRTFCFLHELESLLEHNLIQGGDLDNAIVIVDRMLSDEEMSRLRKLFGDKEVEVKENGILNNVDLYFSNEPARHKLLDVIGDLALVGKPLMGKISACRPGHMSNVEFAKKIRSQMNNDAIMPTVYDTTQPPVCDINVIKGFLPHKYPFLLVDKIIEMTETHVVGVKNVTFNEYFFQGHFPEEPVFPGVLIIESMAQTGGILVMNSIPDPENYTTYFLKIDKAKFKNKVVPGDTLILDMQLTGPIRRGLCEMKGVALVGDKVCAEAHLMAQVARKENK